MPYKDPDPSDPNVLVGVVLPADKETIREMAYVFAEEFARMGHDGNRILRMFMNPYYAGAHAAYGALGDEEIRSIVDECSAAWGGIQFSIGERGGEIQNRQSKIQNGGRER